MLFDVDPRLRTLPIFEIKRAPSNFCAHFELNTPLLNNFYNMHYMYVIDVSITIMKSSNLLRISQN